MYSTNIDLEADTVYVSERERAHRKERLQMFRAVLEGLSGAVRARMKKKVGLVASFSRRPHGYMSLKAA